MHKSASTRVCAHLCPHVQQCFWGEVRWRRKSFSSMHTGKQTQLIVAELPPPPHANRLESLLTLFYSFEELWIIHKTLKGNKVMTDNRWWPGNTLQCGHVELCSQLRWAEKKYTYSNDYTSYPRGVCSVSFSIQPYFFLCFILSLFLSFLLTALPYTFLSPLLWFFELLSLISLFSCVVFSFFINDIVTIHLFLFLCSFLLALVLLLF